MSTKQDKTAPPTQPTPKAEETLDVGVGGTLISFFKHIVDTFIVKDLYDNNMNVVISEFKLLESSSPQKLKPKKKIHYRTRRKTPRRKPMITKHIKPYEMVRDSIF